MAERKNTRSLLLVLAVVFVAAASAGILSSDYGSSIRSRYGEIPKGVVLEGTAKGFPAVEKIGWDGERQAFRINDNLLYRCPVPADQWLDMEAALARDDLMGMSLLDKTMSRAYGRLNSRHKVIVALKEADRFLGAVTFAWYEVLGKRKLPGNYKPKEAVNPTVKMACVYALDSFGFSAGEAAEGEKLPEGVTGRIVCSSRSMTITLFPILDRKSRMGGHLPDYDALNAGKEQIEYRQNADHIRDNIDEYKKVKELATALDYGEGAAFIRYLRDSKIDLRTLRKQMKVYLKTRK